MRTLTNPIKDAFDTVCAEETLKEKTKSALRKTRESKTRQQPWRPIVAIALALVLVIVGGYNYYITPVSAVSFDGQTAIDLEINAFGRVISETAFNEKGERIATTTNNLNRSYDQVAITLFESEILGENRDQLTVTVASKSAAKSQEIEEKIAECAKGRSETIHYHQGKTTDAHTAHGHGISLGKYNAYLELKAIDNTIELKDLQSETTSQLQRRIREGMKHSPRHHTPATEEQHPTETGPQTQKKGQPHGNGGMGEGGSGGGKGRMGN